MLYVLDLGLFLNEEVLGLGLDTDSQGLSKQVSK